MSSLHSAFGSQVSVESVSVESFRRLALDGVRFAGAPGGPFDVEIPRVLVDLHLPIADLVLGRLTPARFVGRVRLLQPAVHWNVQAGQGPLGGMDIEAFIDLMASNPVLGELDCLLEVSDGQFTVLAQPAVSENVTLDEVSASASLDRGKRVSFGLTARWRENESSQLSMTGHLNAEARKYDMAISAEDIGLVDAVPLVYRQLQRLSAVHVLDGVVDLTLSLKGGTATGDLQSQGFSAVLTAEGLQVEVKGLYGSDSIPIGLGGLSVTAAVSHESGAVKARGTASVASLSVGGVKSDDVVCDFEYAGGVLQVSEIGGSLMGGELGGYLSLSLSEEGVRGVGQGRLRGVKSSEIPISGVADVLDARLDGTVSLTFTRSDGLGLTGRLTTLMPIVAGLTFDDGTLHFTCKDGLVTIDSLVLSLNGSGIVVKGSSREGGEANLSPLEPDRSHGHSAYNYSS